MKASNRQTYIGKGRFVSRYESFKQTGIHVNFYNTDFQMMLNALSVVEKA
jgi:hypothetical protein